MTCKICNKRLFAHNTTGFCVLHRGKSEKRRTQLRNNKKKHRDKLNAKAKEYYIKNKNARHDYYLKNLERIREYRKINKHRLKKKSQYQRERSKIDRMYALTLSVRKRITNRLKSGRWIKTKKFNQYIGCNRNELLNHIESQFIEGMSWNNYGLRGWHVDHIKPISLAKTEEELYELCHYTNLQPLWAIDNLKKSNKYDSKTNSNRISKEKSRVA